MTADDALRALEELQTSAPYPMTGFTRQGNRVSGDGPPMEWEFDDDGAAVDVAVAVAVTVLANDDQEGGCRVTVSFSLDVSDVPTPMREDAEFIDGLDRAVYQVIDHVATLLRAHTDPERSADDGAANFTCMMEVPVRGTIEEVMETITDMLAMSATPESTHSGTAASVGLPFAWEVATGDATISGVSPATLTVDARDGGARTKLVVRYTVHLSDAPAGRRDLIIEAFKETVIASGPLWQGAVRAAAMGGP